jgi:hypothetical protein
MLAVFYELNVDNSLELIETIPFPSLETERDERLNPEEYETVHLF